MALSKIDVANMLTGSTPVANGGTALTSGFVNGNLAKVGQVISGGTSSQFTTGSTSFTDVTNCNVAITPSATSSKILIFFNCNGMFVGAHQTGIAFQLVRTIASTATNISTKFTRYGCYISNVSGVDDKQNSCSHAYLDSPSTTSAATYKIQIQRETGSADVRISSNSQASSLIAMEVLA